MSDIFREIEQEVRREEALKLWSKYQIPVFILAALIVAGTGAWRFWEYRQQQQAEALGARYEAAAQLAGTGKQAQAQQAFAAIAAGQGGYALLARLQGAAMQSAHDPAAAAKAYDALAGDPSVPPLLQQLARLRAALLHVDDANPQEAQQRLEALAGPGDPFHATAREELALLAIKAKNYQEAGRWLDMIVTDPAAPSAVRGRAESLMGLVASAGPPPTPPKAKPAAGAASVAPAPAAKPPAKAPPAPAAAPKAPPPAAAAPKAPAAQKGVGASP